MEELYQFRQEGESPLYQQLKQYAAQLIRDGKLENGGQLPTVRDLAQRLGIARGTVKRVYDELETDGLVEKQQGKGTFVSYLPPEKTNRKEIIMAEIDTLLDKMEAMDLSWSEIRIYLDLKLRQRSEGARSVKAAVIECNPEVLEELTQQLQMLPNLELYAFLLDEVRQSPVLLGEEFHLVITTTEHAMQVEKMTPDKRKLAKIALRMLPECVAQIVRLSAGERVGIACGSLRFGQLLYDFCTAYTDCAEIGVPAVFDGELDFSKVFHGKTVLLVPEHYEKYCSSSELRQLREFAAEHTLIECAYGIDEGSFMYVRERIERYSRKLSL